MKIISLLLLVAISAFAQNSTNRNVLLSWSSINDPTQTVNIYRAVGSCGNPFIQVATGITSNGPYIDPLVAPGYYCYQITAVQSGNESDPSNQAHVMIAVPASGIGGATNISGRVKSQ